MLFKKGSQPMQKFRKKPIVVEAAQITHLTFDSPHPNDSHIIGVVYNPEKRHVEIPTLEGTMIGNIGDWIIRGITGELYPCKPDIFEATYEAVDE
jgi:hypothetical protein